MNENTSAQSQTELLQVKYVIAIKILNNVIPYVGRSYYGFY